ncbi:MAG: hypothetical protein A2289_02320 [Deltaproteobacteria bacterium RIFOXYA12_FULL_58_15]|nr:MAG: hypothetical protein A2289_02320 [Deltaproteobacteria bacterium RIFOXYA12_FULL_58_15]OGR11504.1 MAG: hypothetical protein A2341_28430 [Deltaproteobacteria bacterium RIFOXYB12_FULL_58_9]
MSRQFKGRTAAEAAIKACEELGVTRAALRYEIVSETGDDLATRRVVISVEVDEKAAAQAEERYQRDDQPRDERGDRGDRDSRGGSRGRSGPPRGRRDSHESRGGGRDRGPRSAPPRGPRSGPPRGGRGRDDRSGGGGGGGNRGRGGHRPERRPTADDGNIDSLLKLELVPEEATNKRPLFEGDPSERAAAAQQVLNDIVELAGFNVEPRLVQDDDEVHFDLSGEDAVRVIGDKGEALLALQFLINRIVARKAEGSAHLVLDAADYRNRRREALAALARQLADKALTEGKVVRLSPMSAHDRRIFHITLEEDDTVTTRSEGDGLYRPLLIIPERQPNRNEQEDEG